MNLWSLIFHSKLKYHSHEVKAPWDQVSYWVGVSQVTSWSLRLEAVVYRIGSFHFSWRFYRVMNFSISTLCMKNSPHFLHVILYIIHCFNFVLIIGENWLTTHRYVLCIVSGSSPPEARKALIGPRCLRVQPIWVLEIFLIHSKNAPRHIHVVMDNISYRIFQLGLGQ